MTLSTLSKKRRKNKKNKKVKKNKSARRKKTKRRKKKISRKGKKSKKVRFLKENCAPKHKNEVLPFTCYSKSSIQKLKDKWNLRHPDRQITSDDEKTIWQNLKAAMSNTCNKESCWLKQVITDTDVDRKIIDSFSPKAPDEWKSQPNTWLRSSDITKVMKQYENKYPNFQFIGPSPIDYDTRVDDSNECVWSELCRFNLLDFLNQNINKIGIVFNLDPHYKGGSHWVALFIDTKKKSIYYFDSYSNKYEAVPNQIKKFVKTIQKQSESLNLNYEFYYNCKKHQYSNSECGMYCLYIIVKLLEGRNFHKLMENRIEDNIVFNLRQKYFNH